MNNFYIHRMQNDVLSSHVTMHRETTAFCQQHGLYI